MPSEAKDQTFRLTDIEVREVSQVDRAANKRRYLIVKREAMPTGAEVTVRADGTMTANSESKATPPAPPAAAATTQDQNAAPAKPAAPAGDAVSLTQEAKDALAQGTAACADAMAKCKDLIDKATVVPTAGEMSAGALVQALSDCAGMCEDMAYALAGVDESGSVAASADGEVGKRLQVRSAKRVLDNAKIDQLKKTVVEKLGAKMKKERLERFRQAMTILSSIAGELNGEAQQSAQAEADANAAKQNKAQPPAAAAAAPAAPSADVQKLTQENAELRKRLEETNNTLASARDNRQQSQAVAVETEKRAPKGFSWPLDMNSDQGNNRG